MASDGDNELRQANPYTTQHIAGVAEATSLAHLGKIKESDLAGLCALDVKFSGAAWPLETSEEDRRIAALLDVDLGILDGAVDEPEIVTFASQWEDRSLPERILSRIYPGILPFKRSWQAFEAYFAHEHVDDMERCRAQFMIVYDNPLGHRIWSRHPDGKEIIFAPEAGDLVLLDTRQPHAVMPVTAGHDLAAVRTSPLRAFFMTFDDVFGLD